MQISFICVVILQRRYFGERLSETLTPLMEIVTTTDQGIVKAIKNSSIIRWLLKFTSSLRPEDLKKQAQEFSEQFMSVQNGTGVAAVDSKADAKQVDAKDYVPNSSVMEKPHREFIRCLTQTQISCSRTTPKTNTTPTTNRR